MHKQEEQTSENTLFEDIKQYIALRSKIFSLQLTESAAGFLSNLISNGAAVLFFVIFFVFASIGLALLVGQWVNNAAGGFFIIAAFYLLVAIIIWATRERWIERPLTDIFIRNFFKGKGDDEEDQ